MKIEREIVYKAINQEREYQETRWPRPQHNHTNTEYLVYIQYYVNQALTAVSCEDGDGATFPALRKIAALAVAAMEENGVVFREQK
jgi:ribonucleotide reductase beta subunit family protein with ferritin-like domain